MARKLGQRGQQRCGTVIAGMAFALVVVGGTGVSGGEATGLVRVSSRSPFQPGCGVDMASAGFGDGFADAEAEVSLVRDPVHDEILVAAWMQDLYQGYVTATSTDGGATWVTTPVPGTSLCSGGDYELAADPWLSMGVDGRTYLAGFSLDLADHRVPAPHRTTLQVSTSDDAGRSWSAPVVVAAGVGALHDKPAVTAHPRRAGTAHLVWTEETTAFGPLSTGVMLTSTRDGGRTWSPPTTPLPALPPGFIPHGAELLVLPDDVLVVVATLNPTVLPPAGEVLPHALVATTSSDGGATWSSPVRIAGFATRGPSFASVQDPETGDPIQVPGAFASADVGPDGVAVAWRHATSDDAANILVSRSPDGSTWTEPQVVASGTQAFLPTIAVGSDGGLGVAWYDLRDDVLGDAALSASVRLARSQGDGPWLEERLAGPFDLRSAATRRVPAEGRFLGDYFGLVALDSGGFGAAFALPAPAAAAGLSDVFYRALGSDL